MEWNVKNALSRDVEREHLNKILKEIQGAISSGTGGVTEARVLQLIQEAVARLPSPTIRSFDLTLEGDVLGSATIVNLTDTTLEATLAPGVAGIPDAPVDSNLYWRGGGSWQAVPGVLRSLTLIEGDGLVVFSEEEGWVVRTIEGTTGNIVVTDGDGVAGNPVVDLALVPDAGVAPNLLKVVRDVYGRITATEQATAYDVPVASRSGATYDNLQEFLDVMNSPGLITGGTFTDAGSGNLTVAAGTVAIRAADVDTDTLYMANFPASGHLIPNDSTTYYIGIDYNGGSPMSVMKSSDTWNMDTEFPLGSVANLGGTLFPFYNPFKVGDPITNIIQRFDAQATIIRAASGGLILGNTGTRTATLTSGVAWARLNDYAISAKNSGTQTLIGIRPNPTAPPPLVFDLGLTQWPNTQYLSGTTLTTMTNNRWANLWFFVNIATNAWGFAYGTAEYNNASLAAQEGIPSYLTANFLASNLLVGRFIFEKNNNTPIIESAFTRVFSTQAVSDHNQLSNLQGGTAGEYYHLTSAQYTNSAALNSLGTGIAVKTGTGTWAARSLPNGIGYTWTNGSGVAGNPTLTLSDNLQAWSSVTTASKANDSAVVHLTGDEIIAGTKTFTDRAVIGTETASLGFTTALLVESDAASPLSSGAMVRYTNSTAGAFFAQAKARGTRMSPSPVLPGDFLGEFRGFGYHSGSGWSSSTVARMNFRATENFTSTANGTLFSVFLTPIGSTASAEYLNLTPASGLIPGTTDNALDLGGAARRWANVYAGTGTINTSDAREKTEVVPLTANEIAAAKALSKEIGTYKWLAVIAQKGDAARTHIGLTVQRAIEVMESYGLDPFAYGFICYDSWEEQQEVVEETGEVMQQYQPAGDRYSFRMDELMMFIARGFEERLAALENKET